MVIARKTTIFATVFVLWCNGSTTVFGSVSGGSSPPGTTRKAYSHQTVRFFSHRHRRLPHRNTGQYKFGTHVLLYSERAASERLFLFNDDESITFQWQKINLSVSENKSFSGTKSIFQCRYINHFMPAYPPYCVNVYTLLYICVCCSVTSYAPSHCGLCVLRRTGNHFTVMR